MEKETDPNQINPTTTNTNEVQPPLQANQTMPNVLPVNMEASKRSGKKTILITILVFLVVAAGGALAYSHFHKSKANNVVTSSKTITSTQKAATQPAATYSSALAFQPSSSASSSTISLLSLDGSKLASLTSNASDATYDGSGFSQENLELTEGDALITTNKDWSSFAILTSDGKSTAAASSLNTLLAANAHANSAVSLSDSITTGKNILLALENSSTDSKLVKINLANGTITNLFSVVSSKSNGDGGISPVQLITVSRDGTTAYLLTDDVTINSTNAHNDSLVTVDLTTGKFTLKTLPTGIDPQSASVSKDGKLVAYTVSGSNNGYVTVATHIYNVASGKDATVSDEGLLTSTGATDLRFSPDGAFLSEIGNYPADTKKAGMALQIISSSSNSVVHQVDEPNVQNIVTGFDWTNDNKMIYATNSSTTGIFNPDQDAVHSIDASTGKIFDFPASGELLAVLNYQN